MPIIATFLHPYLEKSDEIDLGRSLQMLAIHDIGETVVGDKLAYAKTQSHANKEDKAVRNLLNPIYLSIYDEFEARQSLEARFAKAVDSIAPILHELAMPELTVKRMQYHHYTIDMIIAKKAPHFAFDPMLLEIFEECMKRFEEIEKTTS